MARDTSIETGSVREFSTADYVVFSLLLSLNAVVGLFYAIKDRREKKENTGEYLLGGRNQGVLPVAMSLSVTFLSATSLLGAPVDVYYFDTMYVYMGVGMILSALISAWIFMPFFYRLGYTSTFQYLGERFNPSVRRLGVGVMVCQMMIYMGFVLYGPSLAVSAVTGVRLESYLIGMGVIVTFYTTLGGMKTVLWTDSFQTVIILAGLLAICIEGVRVGGGIANVWEIADERKRIVFDDFSFDPSVRTSFFTAAFGGGTFWLSNYGTSQAQVQRCLSTSSLTKARTAILLSIPFLIAIHVLSSLNGIVAFAFYSDCDPVKFGVIDKKDQLLPLFMLDILGHLQGLPGLFVASIFAGSLSTLSSGVNAIAAVMYEELKGLTGKQLTPTKDLILTKIIAGVCGVSVIGLALLASQLGTLLEASISTFGILNGPLLGLFILGMFFPWANSIGAIVGFLVAVAFMSWIGIGAFVHGVRTAIPSPVSIEGCPWHNGTDRVNTTVQPQTTQPNVYEGVEILYTLSYLNYTTAGMVVEIVVALFVSFITGFTKPSELNPRHVMPMFYMLKAPTKSDESNGNGNSFKSQKSTSRTQYHGKHRSYDLQSVESGNKTDGDVYYSGMVTTSTVETSTT